MNILKSLRIRLCALLFTVTGLAPCFADDTIEIIFDKEPIERDLTFDRKAARPATVKFGNEESAAWMSGGTIEPSMGWTRSFRFKITDPKFQKAARPSMDVEITHHRQTASF